MAESQEDQQRLTADPTSPPDTPTTSSPPASRSRKHSLKPRRQPDFRDLYKHKPLNEDPNIKPFGNGHQFSYQPTFGPDQLSPRSSSSSSSDLDDSDNASPDSASLGGASDAPERVMDLDVIESEEESDTRMSDSATPSDSDDSDASEEEAETSHLTATTTTAPCNFTLEPVDPMDSDCDGLDVLQPTEIESNRSRSRSRPRELDRDMMQDLKNLTCSNETSDTEESPDFEEEAFLRRREQLRKFRRMSMGSSFGKRTHSELSDSEDDGGEALDVNDVGSSARKMRRKMQRTSLLFHDPPPARIEELDEPDSSEDEWAAGQSLARELPYWGAIEIMEMDSS